MSAALKEQQLAAFYTKHDSSKVKDVHTLLTSYPYEDVKASLLAKYKCLPEGWGDDAPAAATSAPLRERQLAAFYQTHDQSKVSAVHNLLTTHSYEDVKASLLAKYKCLPEGWGDAPALAAASIPSASLREQQLAAFYAKHDPSKVKDVHTLLTKYSYDDVKASLQAKYSSLPEGWGDAPAPVAAAAPSMNSVPLREQQLAAFYAKHDPSKVKDVHTLLTKYSYDDVKASLQAKYSSLPEGWGDAPATGATNPAPVAAAPPKKDPALAKAQKEQVQSERKAQLTAFYQKHDAVKVPDVDSLITNYKYDELKMSLIIKYNALPQGWGVADPNPVASSGTAAEQLQELRSLGEHVHPAAPAKRKLTVEEVAQALPHCVSFGLDLTPG